LNSFESSALCRSVPQNPSGPVTLRVSQRRHDDSRVLSNLRSDEEARVTLWNGCYH